MFKKLSQALIKYGMMPLVYYALRLYLFSVRTSIIGEDDLFRHLDSGKKAVAAIWHQRMFGMMGYLHRVSVYSPSLIVSQSRDGELISQIVRLCNFRPIRGSSSKGGAEALKAILADLVHSPFAAQAVDGPRGPRWVIKPGLIVMAQLSRAAVYPVYVAIDRAWSLKSWDRFLIPKPFSRMVIYWDKPLTVPPELDREAFEAIRLKTEKHMRSRQEKLDEEWREQTRGGMLP